MHRIDAPGATAGNLFTEGNPALSVPATEVSDDWLNDVQEEIVNVILDQGISLVKGTQDQLLTAIQGIVGAGGTNIKLDPLANNTADQVISGLSFDKTSVKAAFMIVDVDRRTSTQNEQETQVWVATHDTADDAWRISVLISAFDDAGTLPNITSAGQVRASTDDLTGASYAAELRVTAIFKLAL